MKSPDLFVARIASAIRQQ